MDDRNDSLQQIIDSHQELCFSSRPSFGKSLLIIDQTKEEYSQKFFEKSSEFVILDAKNLHRKRFVRKTPLPILLDEARHLLSYAMLRGKTLVIRFGEIAVDFVNTFCDESCSELLQSNPAPPFQPWKYLPRGFLVNNGELFRKRGGEGDAADAAASYYPHCLLRRDDLREVKEYIFRKREEQKKKIQEEKGEGKYGKEAEEEDDEREERRWKVYSSTSLDINDLTVEEVCRPEFRIIITTTIQPEHLQDMLFNGRFGLPAASLNDFIIQQFP